MFSGLMFCFFKFTRPSEGQEKKDLKNPKPLCFSNQKDRAAVIWGDIVFFLILTSTCSEQDLRPQSCKTCATEGSL